MLLSLIRQKRDSTGEARRGGGGGGGGGEARRRRRGARARRCLNDDLLGGLPVLRFP